MIIEDDRCVGIAATALWLCEALGLHCEDALAGDHDVIDVEVVGRHIVEHVRPSAHQLIEFLSDRKLCVVSGFQLVEPIAGLP